MTFDHRKDCAASVSISRQNLAAVSTKKLLLEYVKFKLLNKWMRSILTAGKNLKNITDGFLTYFNSQYQYVKSQMKASRTV